MTRERDNIAAMSGYVSGEQPDDPHVVKLNTNENAYPPAPAIRSVLSSFEPDRLRRYPPPNADRFLERAASIHGVEPDNIIATRGGDELLRLVITTYVDPGEAIGVTDPTYSLYPVLAQIQNCPVVAIPLASDWTTPRDFAARLNDAGVVLTFLVNPQAPSGVLVNQAQVREIADELDGILLLDEAYVDFVDPKHHHDTVPFIHQCENLVILRSLSKGYSLAGLRFGYGLGAQAIVKPMREKTRDSYNLDWLSQEIAYAALAERPYAKETWDLVRAERSRVRRFLLDLGFLVPESETNFLLVTSQETDARDLHRALKSSGILVRYFDQDGLRDKLRITIGTPDENDQLLSTLVTILAV